MTISTLSRYPSNHPYAHATFFEKTKANKCIHKSYGYDGQIYSGTGLIGFSPLNTRKVSSIAFSLKVRSDSTEYQAT